MSTHAAGRIQSEEALLNRPVAPLLVSGLLVDGSLAVLVSKPGVGKSFVALDLALSIAAGLLTWLGQPLHQHGPVIYFVGEGAGRFGLRLQAWRQRHRVTHDLPFYWVDGAVNLLEEAQVQAFLDEARHLQPKLLVIDTLSRSLSGADENGADTMSSVVGALDAIRKALPGCTVLILHHLNASGTRERGSTVLNGAIDSQFRLSLARNREVEFQVEKQKDLEVLGTFIVTPSLVELSGIDEDGKLLVSVVYERDTKVRVAVGTGAATVRRSQADKAAQARAGNAMSAIRAAGAEGLSKSEVLTLLKVRREQALADVRDLEASGQIEVRKVGPAHYLVAAAAKAA